MCRVAVAMLVAVAVAVAVAGCGASAPSPPGSTIDGTYGDPNGDGALERVAGQPLVDRVDIAPASRPVRQLALFGMIADAHVRDEESPARVPFLDRLGGPFSSTFRPQEPLTAQVLADTAQTLDRLPLQAVIEGGDLVDNAQADEYDQALAALRGGRVSPASGAPGYNGVQSASNPDPFYYRPDVDAPRHPGLLALAQQPFRAPGLRAPWYPVLGNHDILVQGEFAPTPRVSRVAVGSRRLVDIDSSLLAGGRRSIGPAEVQALLAGGLPGRTATTPPDPRRRFVSAGEAIARLRATSGHGAATGGLLDYSFDAGTALRVVVLDTVRRTEGSEGIVRPAQIGWLRGQLEAAAGRYVIVVSHQPLERSAGGDAVLSLLERDPHVIAALAGHTHRNRIEPRGHLWLITTDSVVDYPQQARVFRLVRTADGGVALETWLLDHADANGGDISRQLAYLDAQGGRPQRFAGGRLDRNVRLYLQPPG